MEILFGLGEATLSEVAERISDPPTRPALRSIVTTLVEKGHVGTAGKRGREYVYRPLRQPVPEGMASRGGRRGVWSIGGSAGPDGRSQGLKRGWIMETGGGRRLPPARARLVVWNRTLQAVAHTALASDVGRLSRRASTRRGPVFPPARLEVAPHPLRGPSSTSLPLPEHGGGMSLVAAELLKDLVEVIFHLVGADGRRAEAVPQSSSGQAFIPIIGRANCTVSGVNTGSLQ